jgi:hypothetical protein
MHRSPRRTFLGLVIVTIGGSMMTVDLHCSPPYAAPKWGWQKDRAGLATFFQPPTKSRCWHLFAWVPIAVTAAPPILFRYSDGPSMAGNSTFWSVTLLSDRDSPSMMSATSCSV